jgi:shikimate kinase
MGSGKTTVGKKLAYRMSLEFIDLDHIITQKTGEPINETFTHKGEEFFRQLENETLLEIMKKESFLMAVGGGTPCFFNNMDLMNRHGLTIYLKLSPAELYKRLKGRTAHRPLLKGFTNKELFKYITDKLEKRESWYLQSHLIVNEAEQKPGIILRKINNYKPGSGLE